MFAAIVMERRTGMYDLARVAIGILIGAILIALAFAAMAQQPIIYPAKGQSAQQKKDQKECRAWATDATVLDHHEGSMSATLVGSDGAFVLFGSCAPL